MKMWKKRCGAALTAFLLTGSLAGCSLFQSGSESGEDTLKKAIGISKDAVVMTVNGADVTAERYCYWLNNSTNYRSQQSGDEALDWEEEVDGQPLSEYLKEDAKDTAVLYAVVEEQAAKNHCTLDEKSEEELASFRDYYIQSMGDGDEETYLKELSLQGISEETFLHFAEVSFLYEKLSKTLYAGDADDAESKAELQKFAEKHVKEQGYDDIKAFLEETGYMYAKHILISTVDDDRNPLPEEEVAAKKKQAEDILQQLKNSDEPLVLFDELMNEYSEDPGLAQEPDGYVFGPGEMAEAFENATKALGDNEISDLVESNYGYHIILRRPAIEIFKSMWDQERFSQQLETWVAEADVKTTDVYDKIDPQTLHEQLQKIYDEAHPQESAEPEESSELTENVDVPAPDAAAGESTAAEQAETEGAAPAAETAQTEPAA